MVPTEIYKRMTKTVIFTLLSVCVFLPPFASAHQPRIVENKQTIVQNPEISKAYYGTLTGEPDIYVIKTDKPFELYVNILVPTISNQKKDVSAVVLRDGKEIAVLNGLNFEWKQFYEPFGADTYWMGPEYEARAEAGTYEIRVWSSNNDSKYSLALGKIEAFSATETLNTLTTIPKLKKNFFDKSPASFIASPLGWGLIIILYILAGIAGLTYRTILKQFAKGTVRGAHKNIGTKDRLIRCMIGIGLLVWAILTTWNPVLIFFSGFVLFEAIFSWCGYYAIIGRNSCPIE